MAMPEEIPEGFLELMAGRFRLLGDASRLAILRVLMADGERSVGEVAEAAGQTVANASKHLKLMRDAGMVARRKEGLHAYYSLADPVVERICRLVCDSMLKEAREGAGG